MKPRHLLIALMLCISFTVVGLQPNNATTSQNQSLQQTVEQLQKENAEIREQLDKQGGEIEICRGDVRNKIQELDEEQGRWSAWIIFLVSLVAGALGVLAPYLFSKDIKNEFQGRMTELGERIDQATQDAASAKAALSEITRLKDQIDEIKDKVDNSKTKAEEAANKALASELLSQARSEKDKNTAIDLCSRAIDINPDFAEAYNYRAILKQDSGHPLEAIDDLNKAIKIKPDEFSLYNNRGTIKHILHLYDEALKDFNQAIILNPDNPGTYINKAYLLMDMNRHAEALSSVDEAIKRDTQYSSYYYELRGDIEFEMNRFKEAIEDYTIAIEFNDKSIRAYESRAKCYRAWALYEQGEMFEERNAEFVKKAEEDEKRAEELRNNSSGTSSLALSHTK